MVKHTGAADIPRDTRLSSVAVPHYSVNPQYLIYVSCFLTYGMRTHEDKHAQYERMQHVNCM